MGMRTIVNGEAKDWPWPSTPAGYEFRVMANQIQIADMLIFKLALGKRGVVRRWRFTPVVQSPWYALAGISQATEQDVQEQVMSKAESLRLDLDLHLSPST